MASAALKQSNSSPRSDQQSALQLLNTSRNSVKTLVGSGKAGFADGSSLEAGLSEPGGLARGPNGTVFVADTNNHLVRVLEVDQRSLRTLQLQGVPPPRKAGGVPADSQTKAVPPGAVLVSLDPIKVDSLGILECHDGIGA